MLTAFGNKLIPEKRSSFGIIGDNPEHQDKLVEFMVVISELYGKFDSKQQQYVFSAVLFTLLDSKITKKEFQKIINYWYSQNFRPNQVLIQYLLVIYSLVVAEKNKQENNLFREMLQSILFERSPDLSDALKKEVKMRPMLSPTKPLNNKPCAHFSIKNASAAKNLVSIFSNSSDQNSKKSLTNNTALSTHDSRS